MRKQQTGERRASERASDSQANGELANGELANGERANGELAYAQAVTGRAGGSKTAGQSVGRADERPDGETSERAHAAGKLDDGCVLQARREAGASMGDGYC